MKTIKVIALLTIIAAMLCNCAKISNENDISKGPGYPLSYEYILYIGFQDVSGNDLVKGIRYIEQNSEKGVTTDDKGSAGEVEPDLYMLKIFYPEAYMDPVWGHYHSGASMPNPTFGYKLLYRIGVDDNTYLLFSPYSSVNYYKELPPADKITYKFYCPYVFGNNDVHEIVAYWKEGNKHTNSRLCYRIELDGKELDATKITYEEHNQVSKITIILDR